jgi:hypothetical protein
VYTSDKTALKVLGGFIASGGLLLILGQAFGIYAFAAGLLAIGVSMLVLAR